MSYLERVLKPISSMNIVGREVARLRFQQGLTQDALSARCQVAGLDIGRGTLAKIEAEIRQVTDYEVWILSVALKVPVEQLFTKAHTAPPPTPKPARGLKSRNSH